MESRFVPFLLWKREDKRGSLNGFKKSLILKVQIIILRGVLKIQILKFLSGGKCRSRKDGLRNTLQILLQLTTLKWIRKVNSSWISFERRSSSRRISKRESDTKSKLTRVWRIRKSRKTSKLSSNCFKYKNISLNSSSKGKLIRQKRSSKTKSSSSKNWISKSRRNSWSSRKRQNSAKIFESRRPLRISQGQTKKTLLWKTQIRLVGRWGIKQEIWNLSIRTWRLNGLTSNLWSWNRSKMKKRSRKRKRRKKPTKQSRNSASSMISLMSKRRKKNYSINSSVSACTCGITKKRCLLSGGSRLWLLIRGRLCR